MRFGSNGWQKMMLCITGKMQQKAQLPAMRALSFGVVRYEAFDGNGGVFIVPSTAVGSCVTDLA
jgi:hypothetical protein